MQATFCDVLVDEWYRQGIRYVAVAPGSRSTPLALALVAQHESQSDFVIDVFHDERSAAFAALGSALATGVPAVVLCTSGTASAHLHAAIIEADLSAVPMIACTADRPEELRDVGAAQTVDQTKLFGQTVRWFHDPGVPTATTCRTWRSLAARSVWETQGPRPGPVHLNFPFREPLVGRIDADLRSETSLGPRSRTSTRGSLVLDSSSLDRIARDLEGSRGVIVAGRGCGTATDVARLAEHVGWPIFADPRSGCSGSSHAVHHFDSLLRIASVSADFRPDVVLRLGEPPASKVLSQWVSTKEIRQIHVTGNAARFDPDHRIGERIVGDPDAVISGLVERVSTAAPREWFQSWKRADERARDALSRFEAESEHWSGPSIARAVVRSLPVGAHLVLSSSMPIRDVEWFAGDTSHLRIHANRGANGIDGVIATAIGVARSSRVPTCVLLGDVAAIHDASTLLGLSTHDVDLRVIVVNNDGGGIFHHLPQASLVEAGVFERLYGTPHGLDFARLAQVMGVSSVDLVSPTNRIEVLSEPGPRLIGIRTDRVADTATHQRIHALVADTVAQARTSADSIA